MTNVYFFLQQSGGHPLCNFPFTILQLGQKIIGIEIFFFFFFFYISIQDKGDGIFKLGLVYFDVK
jgi:hypothetical protein